MDASGPQTVDYGPMVSHREDPAWTDSQAKQAYARQPPTPSYDYQQPSHPMIQPPSEKKERTICGFRVATFVLSLLLFLVIVGAAIGGGVGGSMAARSSRSQEETSETPSPTSIGPAETSSAPSTTVSSAEPSIQPTDASRVEVPTTGLLPLDCPGINGTTHQVLQNDTRENFRIECGADVGATGTTIASFVAYSFENCMEACTANNRYRNEKECVAVAFTIDLQVVDRRYATCWLKNSTRGRKGFPEATRHYRAIGWLM